MEEFCDITLVSDDGQRIEARKVVLASASPILRDLLQYDDDYNEYQVSHMKMKSRFMSDMVDLVYTGQ